MKLVFIGLLGLTIFAAKNVKNGSEMAQDWTFLADLSLVAAAGDGSPVGAAGDLADLDHPDSKRRRAALERVGRFDSRSLQTHLEVFDALGPFGRLALAEAVKRVGEIECLEFVLGALSEPSHSNALDSAVRIELAGFLGRTDLADRRIPERTSALEQLALSETDAGVVAAAVEALVNIHDAAAGKALDRLLDVLDGAAGRAAVRGLGRTAAGRAAAMRRARQPWWDAGSAEPALSHAMTSELLTLYGRLLADLPRGGVDERELAPLVAGAAHPSDAVRVGARFGFEALRSRLRQLGEVERLEEVFAAFARAGWDGRDLDYLLARLLLQESAQPQRALAPARRLAKAPRTDSSGRLGPFYGQYFESMALLMMGQSEAALGALDRAQRSLDGLASERVDLQPLGSRPSLRRAREQVELFRLGAQVALMRALRLLDMNQPPSHPEVLQHLRAAHVQLLRSAEASVDLEAGQSGDMDLFFDHDLGPRILLLQNPNCERWPRERGIELLAELGRGLASIAPNEMPGFEPVAGLAPELSDPYEDPERFALLLSIEGASQRLLRREADEVSRRLPLHWERQVDTLLRRWQYGEERLRRARNQEDELGRAEAYKFLEETRRPSSLALSLARDLRDEGRPAEGRVFLERMQADLRETGRLSDDPFMQAEIGAAIAATYTEENNSERAEEILLEVLVGLEEVENLVLDMLEDARELGDLEDEARRRRQLRMTRNLEGDTLVSLAVNANVRMGDSTRALGYFERAFALFENDFMRVLLACYRARSGHAEQARAVLREVSPAPNLYYNMACTYALLGQADLALDFLQRDFEENAVSKGSLGRQQDWAKGDPDLASLRDDPRFEELVQRAAAGR